MAKKATVKKSPKGPTRKSKPQTRRPSTTVDTGSLSVTDGAMKDVIRAAFLRREK